MHNSVGVSSYEKKWPLSDSCIQWAGATISMRSKICLADRGVHCGLVPDQGCVGLPWSVLSLTLWYRLPSTIDWSGPSYTACWQVGHLLASLYAEILAASDDRATAPCACVEASRTGRTDARSTAMVSTVQVNWMGGNPSQVAARRQRWRRCA